MFNRVLARSFHASGSKSKIFELRTYSVKPKFMPQFIALTNEHIHLRTAHSKLHFYGATELGGQNQVVHIWEYDHYSHRTNVRAALGADQEWQSTYFSKIREWMDSQYNVVMKEAYGYKFEGDEEAAKINAASTNAVQSAHQRVYELRRYKIQPGKSDEWWEIVSQGLPARTRYNKPLGIWRASIGELSTFYVLYNYDALDSRDTLRHKAMGDATWRKSHVEAAPYVMEAESKIILPLPFSPLK